VHEVYLKKKELIEKGPWFSTLNVLPIWTVFEIADGEAIDTPAKVPWAYPEKDASPPELPVCAV
jgi:hypothetical protein